MRRIALSLLVLVAVAGLLVVAAWAIDTSQHEGRVPRNVTLAGQGVGGMSRDEVAAVVARLAPRYAGTTVEVDAAGGGFSAAATDLGLVVDEARTVQAALTLDRRGAALTQLREWIGSFVGGRPAPVHVGVDRGAVYRVVATNDTGRTPPTEPSVREEKGRLVAVAGKPGRGIDAARVIEALPAAATRGTPLTLTVERGDVPPRFSLADARRLAAAGEAATDRPLPVTVDGKPASVEPAPLRSWLRTQPADDGLRLVVDAARATAQLGELLPAVGTPPVETRFEVVGDAVQIVPGRAGTGCCGPDAGARVDRAVQARLEGVLGAEPVALPARRVDPKLTAEKAAALGINEQVGTFTTNHKPNQPRVSNIHRIADLVRGQFIEPGGTFSINDFVGKRTVEKGFVVDAVIEEGRFTESVGGGISQFATTAFNAAFFAGLEFAEYQSHSIYISRYPYGREATLSYPHPDLKIRNPSPYGVLIWTSYTDRSITVTLYSTRWAEVAQTAQTTQPRGPCTRVRTERTRRFLDGTTKVDHVSALYRPEEGVNCT
ncbi:MAG: VanW family protein [Actinomycetota bacterium]|nr:VanW family protein [Actinomycetota bacterium]